MCTLGCVSFYFFQNAFFLVLITFFFFIHGVLVRNKPLHIHVVAVFFFQNVFYMFITVWGKLWEVEIPPICLKGINYMQIIAFCEPVWSTAVIVLLY